MDGLRAALFEQIRRVSPDNILLGRVLSVGAESCGVELLLDGVVLEEVALQSVINEERNGALFVPKVGSVVAVGFPNGQRDLGFVLACAELERLEVLIGDVGLRMDKEGVVFNDGEFGGLVKIGVLVERLNALEREFKLLALAFNTHLHIVTAPGAPTPPPTVPFVDKVELTVRGALEDVGVKH